jgi:transcriptional/translational regulatory protein YebC/TACO1
MWQFEILGKIVISPFKIIEAIDKGRKVGRLEKIGKDDLILEIMDWTGVKDVEDLDDRINIITTKEDFKSIYNKLSDGKYKIEKAEIIKLPKNKIEIKGSLSKVEETINELEELDDIVATWTNVNL